MSREGAAGPCPSNVQLFELVDGICSAEDRTKIEHHLDACSMCRRVLALAAGDSGPLDPEDGQRDDPWAVGDSIGRYRILRTLGRGGMGVVVAAHDPQLDREVAIKLVRPERGSLQTQARMLREAQALGQLSHPHVVAVYDVGRLGAGIFIAMELIEGSSLRTWSRGRPWAEVLERYIEAGRGLAAAHEQGIVHRDFKPSNALVGADGRVRVCDFGLALVEGERSTSSHALDSAIGSGSLTQTGTVLGTPAYMAPEQMMSRAVTASSDQFSFAVALYAALYDSRPFPGATMDAILCAIRSGPAPPPASPVPRAVRVVLRRGLSLDPQDRYPTMHAMVEALDRARHGHRRWGWGALAVLGGVLGLGGSALGGDASRCTDPPATFSSVWNAVQRQRLIHATGTTDSATVSMRRIDRFASEWTTAHAELCEAQRDGALQPSVVERGRRCLQDRVSEFEAALDVLRTRASRGRVAEILDVLEPPGHCADVEFLSHAAFPLVSDSQRGEYAELRRGLDRADAIRESGEHGDALRLLDSLHERIVALDHPPLQARFLAARAHLIGTVEPASKVAYEVAFDYAREHGMDLYAIHAARALAQFHRGIGADIPAAERWVNHADAIAERSGDPVLAAIVSAERAALLYRQARYEDAEPYARRAVESFSKYLEPSSRETARGHSILAKISRRRRDFETARMANDRALTIHLRRHRTHRAMVPPLGGIWQSAMDDADLEEAEVVLEEQLRIVLATDGPGSSQHASNTWRWAQLAREQGDYDAAVEYAHSALAMVEDADAESNPKWRITMLRELGLVHTRRGDHQQALQAHRQALALAEEFYGAESENDAATTHHNLGEVESALGHWDRAADHYRAAISIFARASGPERRVLLYPLTGLGEVELARGRVAPARALLERALPMARTEGVERREWAETAFALARALWQPNATESEQERALLLARSAERIFAEFPGFEAEHQEVTRWLEVL